MKERAIDSEWMIVTHNLTTEVASQALVRRTIHRRQYRLKARPSRVADRTKFFFRGPIRSIPRHHKRFRNLTRC